MAIQDGRIVAPVSISDVQKTLGLSFNDVGNLCCNTHGKINKWSRYKPVRHTSLVPLTDAQFKSVNFGFKAPLMRSGSTPIGTLSDEWVYDYPLRFHIVGQPISPFRLSDFKNYMHTAAPMNKVQQDVKFFLMLSSTLEFNYYSGLVQPDITYRIGLADFASLAGYYLCIWIKETGKTTIYWKTADDTLDKTGSVNITHNEIIQIGNGTSYEYHLCASNTKKVSLSSANVQSNFYALPAGAASELSANFTLSSESPVSMSLTGLATRATNELADNFVMPDLYTGPAEIGNFQYFDVHLYYNLQLRYTITNKSSEGIVFHKSLLRYYLNKTFSSNSEVNNLFSHVWVRENGAFVEVTDAKNIELLPGEQTVVVFEIGNAMLRGGSTAVSGQKLSIMTTIKYNSVTLTSAQIRLQN